MNNPIIVLGMHRSGTSLLASWLHASGINMGNDLLGAEIGNAGGHFEDMEFLDLHESILWKNGIFDGALRRTGPILMTGAMLRRMAELVAVKQKQQHPWGWKEPRTCLFMRHYMDLLPEAKLVVVYRHHNLVVDSLMRRSAKVRQQPSGWQVSGSSAVNAVYRVARNYVMYGLDPNAYLKSWIRYNEEVLLAITRVGRRGSVVVDCSELAARSGDISAKLAEWGVPVKAVDIRSVQSNELLATTASAAYDVKPELRKRAEETMSQLQAASRP